MLPELTLDSYYCPEEEYKTKGLYLQAHEAGRWDIYHKSHRDAYPNQVGFVQWKETSTGEKWEAMFKIAGYNTQPVREHFNTRKAAIKWLFDQWQEL